MPRSRLDPTQQGVLEALAQRVPGWTLTGGGALVGFHLGHRLTRDLDLFWHGRSELVAEADAVPRALRDAGFAVVIVQSAPAFIRLRVERGGQTTIVDLVAEPVRQVEPPEDMPIGAQRIRVDTAQEILANKLCALLHRSELRDLVDIAALLEHGADLERALRDAPRKEGGFSPLTLTWLLKEMPLEAMARASGLAAEELARLIEQRAAVVSRIARLATPGT